MHNIEQIISTKSANISKIEGYYCENETHLGDDCDVMSYCAYENISEHVCEKCGRIMCFVSICKNGCIMCIYPNILEEKERWPKNCWDPDCYILCYECGKILKYCHCRKPSPCDSSDEFTYKNGKIYCHQCF